MAEEQNFFSTKQTQGFALILQKPGFDHKTGKQQKDMMSLDL